MLSILIPTYNYNAFSLASVIEKQALKAGVTFELLCIDDGSLSQVNIKNQNINTLTNCSFIEGKKNIGRNANRHLLATKAQYNWLLFIDADVLPKQNTYIEKYLNIINKDFDAVFGGFAYQDETVSQDKTLRYTFGKKREEIDAAIRNKTPYKVIISANFLIKKSLFLNINKTETKNLYGLDYLFGALLKQKRAVISHINNEVYHFGIDTNAAYLDKTKKAVQTLYYIHYSKKINTHDISLLKAYKYLRFFRVHHIFGKLLLYFNSKIEANLLGKTPSLFYFDLYRLGVFCRIKA